MHYRDQHVDVRLSRDGLARAYRDNDLRRIAVARDRACGRFEIALIWLITIALGVLMGATAAQTAGLVS